MILQHQANLLLQPQIGLLRPRRMGEIIRPQLLEPQASIWALGFVNAVVDLNNLGGLDVPFSVAAWIKTTDTSGLLLGGNALDWVLTVSLSKLRFAKNTIGGGVSSNTDVANGDRHHFVATYDGSDVNFYLNGSADGGGSWSQTFIIGVKSIGDTPDNVYPLAMTISDVCVYNRILSAAESKNLYEKLLIPSDLPNLMGWWRFQEGFGAANGTQIRDWSGRGNHGSMQGFSGDPWKNIGVR